MRHCIIIGAGPGLGEAVARKFGANGYGVGLIARNKTALVDQVARLGAFGIEARYAVADAGHRPSRQTKRKHLRQASTLMCGSRP